MGMSTHVVGFKPPDEKWKKMKAVYDACAAAKIVPPKEVGEFFGFNNPDENGVEVRENDLVKAGCLKPYATQGQSGFEIDITKLPKDVTIVRFFNSW